MSEVAAINGAIHDARERVHATCPKCGSEESAVVIVGRDLLHAIPGEYYVSQCSRCGLWFQNPRPPRDAAPGFYPADYAPHADPQSVQPPAAAPPTWSVRVRRAIGLWSGGAARSAGIALEPRMVPGGRLLEIGCASGARLIELRGRGWVDLHGIELGEAAAATARRNGFDVRCGDADALLDAFPDRFFDVIIASMVIEHFLDPFATVRRLARKLKPGGQFLFSTVCRDSVDARIYRSYWRNLDLPRHMVWLRRKDIRDMLAPLFEDVEIFSQAEAIDFVGSAALRRTESNHLFDRMVMKLGVERLSLVSRLLARLGLTSRVSVRCARRED